MQTMLILDPLCQETQLAHMWGENTRERLLIKQMSNLFE